MWWIADLLIVVGMVKITIEWLDDLAAQNTEREAERRSRQAELDDEQRDEL